MLIGYMRVSKADGSQTLDLQKDALINAGIAPDRIYEDLASGRLDDRPGLNACLKALQPGNTLVIWKLDRLGRNLRGSSKKRVGKQKYIAINASDVICDNIVEYYPGLLWN